MQNIRLVDLKNQYLKIKKDIDKAIQGVIDQTSFIKGEDVLLFEQELENYLGSGNVISCGNGTDALQIALMALDLPKGSEIITPSFTFGSTVEVIALLGMKPVLVDVNPSTFTINPKDIASAITNKTKAIIPVHLYGQNCDMQEIMNIARDNSLYVVEDACQSIGANYSLESDVSKKSGTIGHIGCYSFFPSKNLGCFGDGGALFTNDNTMAKKIATIKTHGMVKKYHYEMVGINSRLDTIQAAILRVKLRYLDNYNKKRQEAAKFYDKELSQCNFLKIPYIDKKSEHTYHQYTITLSDDVNREDFMKYMKSKNIPTGIYYPVPLHLQKAYKYLGYKINHLPVTEKLCKKVLSLPMHTELDDEQLEYITTNVLKYYI